MTIDGWITIAILAVAVALMVTDTISPPEGIIGATIGLTVTGVISFDEAFAGFASTAAITVGAYYIVAAAIEKTGALLPVLPYLLGRGRRPRLGLARLTIPSAAASGFVSNTPIVAMMIDPIRAWSRRTGIAASKVLIPLSYATILGGTITLIGTSTNLLVSDLFAQSGGEEFDFFTTAVIGLPVAVIGLTLIILLAPILLPRAVPGRRSPRTSSAPTPSRWSWTRAARSTARPCELVDSTTSSSWPWSATGTCSPAPMATRSSTATTG